MTASMAAPREPDEGDEDEAPVSPVTVVGSAPRAVPDLTQTPPKPQISADQAAAETAHHETTDAAESASPTPRAPAKPPRKKRPPRLPAAANAVVAGGAVVADPGPPPPLPPDLVDVAPDDEPPLDVDSVDTDDPPVDLPPVDLDVVVPPIPPPPVAASVVAEAVLDSTSTQEPADEPVTSVADSEPPADAPAPPPVPETEPRAEPLPEQIARPVVDHAAVEAMVVAIEDDLEASPGADAATPALVLRGVRKTFGETHAVDGIDLTVPAGTFYGIVGPNGAGKTTTLSMIAGLLQPDKGRITVNGVDAASDPRSAKRGMGVLPDRLRTFDRLTGRQLLYYYGVLRGLPPAVVESRTADLARAFDLTGALGRVVSDYSTGMTKKVMLAGAMIHSPRLLVLDEPFESVDPVSSAIILDILATYVAHGGTVVLSSHGMDLVERVCTRVAVIVAGQVLAEGTIDEVKGELTLEQRFIELAGGLSDVEGLEWLHTFSD